ncbi:MAG: exodeoxyribonuclease V subunit gamma [Clostridia bacterium]|nr:exodeoxyribonuclease V subunit gamma [Clostridia bacterium]
MLALLEELRGCAIDDEQYESVLAQLEDGALKQKLQDLIHIEHGYQALIANSYLDPVDDLAHLAEDLPQWTTVHGATVFVDGFKSFTGLEMKVLEQLMILTESLTVTLGYDQHAPYADGLELFSEIVKTSMHLQDLARKNGVPVQTPQVLTNNFRHRHSPALSVLEERLYRIGEEPADVSANGVELMCAGNVYEECRLAVRRLHRFLREGGRCRDTAVVVRDLGTYRGILEPMLERAEIPYFIDSRETVRTDPLIVTVIEALQCASGGWNTEALLRLMKTGLLGFSPRTIAKLENYLYMWNIRGAAWQSDWAYNPDGLSAPVTEKTRQTLHYLNILRRRLYRPLKELRDTLADGCTGRQFAEAVYQYLCKTKARRAVVRRVKRLQLEGDADLASRAARVWDILMDMLDQFAAAAGEEVQQGEEFLSMFSLAADLIDIGSVPPGIDVVQIGQADRSRYSAPKLVLILGANAGVFPQTAPIDGLLGDAERMRLVECGLPLTDTSAHRMIEERYFAYAAVSAACESLYVSWLEEDAEGNAAEPSSLVEEIRRLLPQTTVGKDDPSEAETAEELLHYMAQEWKCRDTLAASLHKACAVIPETAERYNRMRQASEDRALRFASPDEAKRLFTKLSAMSPTAVETYYQCPFGYYCKYGLRLKEREKAELNALEFGTAAHHVMETCIPRYVESGFSGLRKTEVMQDAAAALKQYVDEVMGGLQDKPDRFLYLLSRLERLCGYFLWHVVRELRQSRFVPTDYELRIGNSVNGEPAVPALDVALPDGTSVRVYGTIDRVDVYKAGDQSYVRVVDYKTGYKEFRLDDIVNGINLQMLIYLSALWENGGPRHGTVVPAGMLYLPSKLPVVSSDVAEQQEVEQTKAMTMNGLILDNPEIVCAMEAEAQGLFIPVKLDRNGNIQGKSASSVATLAQFGLLKRRAENLLREMAESLRSGAVEPCPTVSKTVDACRYCRYSAICGHEAGDPARELAVLANRDVLEMLEDAALPAKEERDADGETGGSADPH